MSLIAPPSPHLAQSYRGSVNWLLPTSSFPSLKIQVIYKGSILFNQNRSSGEIYKQEKNLCAQKTGVSCLQYSLRMVCSRQVGILIHV